jgi:hypothetical protein
VAGILIGVVLLLVAAGLYWFANRSKQRGAGMAAAPTVPVKDLAAVGTALVEVVGTATVVGPQLTSPLGGRPCVWFRSTVHEIRRERDTNSQGRTTTRTREHLVSSDTSTTAIAIDDGTGVVMVRLDGLDVNQPVLAHDQRVADRESLGEQLLEGFLGGDDCEGFRQREHIIPVGQRLFAIGAVSNDPGGPWLTQPAEKGQPFLVSTRDEASLQRSAASSARWLTIGAVVAALAGVAAIVAGAVA